jgi:hypothetical protein
MNIPTLSLLQFPFDKPPRRLVSRIFDFQIVNERAMPSDRQCRPAATTVNPYLYHASDKISIRLFEPRGVFLAAMRKVR